MTAQNPDRDFWRELVNNIPIDLPEDGKSAPQSERRPMRRRGRPPNREGSRKVQVQRIITTIYVMTDIEGQKYTSSTHQTMAILGEMTLEDALKLSNMELDK